MYSLRIHELIKCLKLKYMRVLPDHIKDIYRDIKW